ncbi:MULTISPECIES: hypothetical protein [Streptomyces]|uniref:hypothetical protein n=1 Tax=Streptomyces TaxID=1883 RepID=UPI000A6DA7EE|nr:MULTISPECIES: hypothetical protein [Streptomyces]
MSAPAVGEIRAVPVPGTCGAVTEQLTRGESGRPLHLLSREGAPATEPSDV